MELLTASDRAILVYLNSFAHRCWSVDAFVYFLASNELVKGGFVVSIFYLVWFESQSKSSDLELTEKRQVLLYTILVCIPGLIVTRSVATLLPFRQRPLYNPELHLNRAFTFVPNSLETCSSFPSAHALLFFALATGIFLVSRKTGVWLFLYTVFCIALPTIFLGSHYPR